MRDEHTPGDWTTSREDLDSFTANPETGEVEHVVYIYRGDQPRVAVFAGKLDNARADARLMAASPKLLAACELIMDCFAYVPDSAQEPKWYAAARKAIAAAVKEAP